MFTSIIINGLPFIVMANDKFTNYPVKLQREALMFNTITLLFR